MKRLLPLLALALAGCDPVDGEHPDAVPLIAGTVRVTGDSMLPTLAPGQVVVVNVVPFSALQVGDVIVFQRPEGRVVHRIAEVHDGWVWTRGDNNGVRDRFSVRPNQILGRVAPTR